MIAAALRIKNEARWIAEVIESIAWCDEILVMDDHSDDGTPDICRRSGATVYESPFEGFDEARDKDWLLSKVFETTGVHRDNWCLWIDGDEVLEYAGEELIREFTSSNLNSYTLQIVYLWDRRDQVRVDGVYGRFRRPSLFRLMDPAFRFQRTGRGNLHCSSVPVQLLQKSGHCPARLLHLGYMDRSDRLRKWLWYNETDPGNRREDCYTHLIQGDVPEVPADKKLVHAGPLKLESL